MYYSSAIASKQKMYMKEFIIKNISQEYIRTEKAVRIQNTEKITDIYLLKENGVFFFILITYSTNINVEICSSTNNFITASLEIYFK